MDQTAINAIAELGLTGVQKDLSIPYAILPGQANVVSLEKFMDAPSRQKSTFRAHCIAAFTSYVDDNKQDDTTVFVSADGKGAVAIIDYKGWGDHVCELQMQLSDMIVAVNKLTKNPVTQRELVEFVEDWSDHVSADEMDTAKLIAAIRRINIKSKRDVTTEQGNFSASKSSMENIEATSSAGKLPGEIAISGPIYAHEPYSAKITLKLNIVTDGDTPMLRVRWARKELDMLAASSWCSNLIGESLAHVSIYLGEID